MSTNTLIDAHCHLDFEIFDADRDQVLQRAADSHISDIVIPGTQRNYWDRVRKLCYAHKQLHACYGLHPYWLNDHEQQHLRDLENYVVQHRPVAIGECGLDFRPGQVDRAKQLDFFSSQLEIAQQHQLPVVIHAVKATEMVLTQIRKFNGLSGMIHSFSGSAEQARQLIELNFYISIGASVSYERAKKLRAVVKTIPVSSLLVETDAPDQPAEKYHGQRNEPAYLVDTVELIAELRGESFDSIASQTTINARNLFAIKARSE